VNAHRPGTQFLSMAVPKEFREQRHLKAVFAKTGTHQQGELVALLSVI
jgi:hypothetical protein